MKKSLNRNLIMFFVSFASLNILWAENPIITHMYTADPSARVFDGVLYLYPSHDRDEAVTWDMVDWHVFSTTDMKNYKDHGVALSLKDLPWAKEKAWAPDCIRKDGKYYFYYPTDRNYIGVAVSDKPYGPFKDPLGKPLISRWSKGVDIHPKKGFIDPNVFIDDDGKAYLFAGNSTLHGVQLNDDMISYSGEVKKIEGAKHFFEGAWVHKYKGKYYMSYSGRGKILYAMSDNIMGPYEYKGEILDKVNSGTNHHSILEYKGQWYIFYHNADLSRKNFPPGHKDRKYVKWRRSVCVEYLSYNADGTIKKVKQTKEGVQQLLPESSKGEKKNQTSKKN